MFEISVECCSGYRGDDGATYIVRHDARAQLWELTVMDRSGPP